VIASAVVSTLISLPFSNVMRLLCEIVCYTIHACTCLFSLIAHSIVHFEYGAFRILRILSIAYFEYRVYGVWPFGILPIRCIARLAFGVSRVCGIARLAYCTFGVLRVWRIARLAYCAFGILRVWYDIAHLEVTGNVAVSTVMGGGRCVLCWLLLLAAGRSWGVESSGFSTWAARGFPGLLVALAVVGIAHFVRGIPNLIVPCWALLTVLFRTFPIWLRLWPHRALLSLFGTFLVWLWLWPHWALLTLFGTPICLWL
jgi:hypothetical protein